MGGIEALFRDVFYFICVCALALACFSIWAGLVINKAMKERAREKEERKMRLAGEKAARAKELALQRDKTRRQQKEQRVMDTIRATDAGTFRRKLGRALAKSDTRRAADLVMILPAPLNQEIISVIQAIDGLKRMRARALDCGVATGTVDDVMVYAGRMEAGLCSKAESVLLFAQGETRDLAVLNKQSTEMAAYCEAVSKARTYLDKATADAATARLGKESDNLSSLTQGLTTFIAIHVDPLDEIS